MSKKEYKELLDNSRVKMTKLNAPIHVLKGKGQYSEDRVERKRKREKKARTREKRGGGGRKYIKEDVCIIDS